MIETEGLNAIRMQIQKASCWLRAKIDSINWNTK